VTHEYIDTPSGNRVHSFDKKLLFISDIGDGGSKSDKSERDIRLLLKGIEEQPNSDRYHFYLANTYFDSGRFDEAIETYQKRIKLGGWDQEVWYSYYRIGLSYKSLGKMEQAVWWWLDGYNYLPKRVENLYEIIQHYRYISKCKLAYQFYKIAKESLDKLKPGEKDSFLFLKNDVYTYKLEYELSIISCYIGVLNIDKPAIAVLNNSNDQGIIRTTLSNMKFYDNKIHPTAIIDLGFSMNHQIANKYRSFNSSSSSIIETDLGYLLNVRMVNYVIDDKGKYNGCEDHIVTVNKCIELNKNFKVINEVFIDSKFDGRLYIGVEDVKIFKNTSEGANNEIIFTGTGLHKTCNIGVFYGKYDRHSKFMEAIELKVGFNMDSPCEKNWVFFMDEVNELKMIYNWHPLQICNLQVNDKQGVISIKETREMPKIFKHARGSSNGFIFKNEVWFICHIVSYEEPRHYYHIFAVFDRQMNLLRYSAPFKFEKICIEYCLSLIVEENRIIVPYSTWDRTTKIAIINGHDLMVPDAQNGKRSLWNNTNL
jgi:hypothetical protein